MQSKIFAAIAIVFCLLLHSGAPLFAAEDEATPTADSSEDQTAEEMLAAEAALEAQETQTGGGDTDTDADSPDAADAPLATDRDPRSADEDFVPTIQISEDLSVSFPVDI